MRAVQAANADIVYAGAYPPDSVGLVRAANEIGLNPKMFGGALIGQLVTADQGANSVRSKTASSSTKASCPSPKLNFPGLDDLMKRYQPRRRS
jgi:branched-chain amino acid transport system substrate-binding protein